MVRARRWGGVVAAAAVGWAMLGGGVAMARDAGPVTTVALDPMGFQTLAPEFLNGGSSMLTVHFVDKDHLLITFSVRRLMKREADSVPDDDDRTIGAFVVELPSGKVLARTEWRLHDRAQYLWSLGRGRFLLRVRDRLTVFAPLEAANSDDAFREYPFLQTDRRIVAILVSADDDLLTLETSKPPIAGEGEAGLLASREPTAEDPAPVQINFYRLTGDSANRLKAISAGAIRTRAAVGLPLTAVGYLDVIEGGRDQWLFNFEAHTGKVSELSEFDTTCYPHATFVGHGEFVAFGCRGSDDKQDLAGFNLKGDAMWQQNFLDTHVFPTFSFAPAAGRFALGRVIVGGPVDPYNVLTASQVNAEEVRVYQSYNGKQLLRAECTPVERAGQNFALSPDGMELAVVQETLVRHPATKDDEAYTERTTGVAVYALPPLADADAAAVKAAEAMAPADTGARIDVSLTRVATPAAAAANTAAAEASGLIDSGGGAPATAPDAEATTQAGEKSGTTAATGSDASGNVVEEGDPEPSAPRKPPTLYGPGETPPGKPQ